MHNVHLIIQCNVLLISLDLRMESRQRHRLHERNIHIEPAWSKQHATVHIRSLCRIIILRYEPIRLGYDILNILLSFWSFINIPLLAILNLRFGR